MLKQRLLMASGHSAPPVGHGIYSWGDNTNGQTGQNTFTGQTLSPTLMPGAGSNWSMIVACNHSLGVAAGIKTDGTLWTWGSNQSGGGGVVIGSIAQGNVTTTLSVPTQVGTGTNWAWVSLGNYGGIGVKSDGTAWSWGQDQYGELGQGGGSANYYTPTQIGAGTTWAKSFMGTQFSFLIDTTGKLYALGRNLFYATGLGTSSGSATTPTLVGSATNWTYVTCNIVNGALGLRSDGTLWSWGTDLNGELFQGSVGGTFTTPTQVGSATDWSAVSTSMTAANAYTLSIKGGTLMVAGSNAEYQTGRGTNTGNTTTPTQVGVLTTWTHVTTIGAGGAGAGAGRTSDGKLWSWGNNVLAQTGQGTDTGFTTSPTQVGALTSWTSVVGGGTAGFAKQ